MRLQSPLPAPGEREPHVTPPSEPRARTGGARGALRRAISDWRVKGMVQKVLGYVPAGDELHYWLQSTVGGLAGFGRELDIKVDDWRLMMGHLATASVDLPNASLLEIGTGWYPTFPSALYLAGARKVITVDLNRHMRPDLVRRMAARLLHHLPTIASASGAAESAVTERYIRFAVAIEADAAVERATGSVVEYDAPADASATNLSASSVDVVFSNSVLEHVPPDGIRACFAEAMRILRPGGIMFHSVNCGDHYAYTDRSIDQLHYLKYSDNDWQRWNNKFLYQNRLRAIDFTAMAAQAGFSIELDTSRAKPERLAQLDAIAVHPTFRRYTREQLAITSIDFVARKP